MSERSASCGFKILRAALAVGWLPQDEPRNVAIAH